MEKFQRGHSDPGGSPTVAQASAKEFPVTPARPKIPLSKSEVNAISHRFGLLALPQSKSGESAQFESSQSFTYFFALRVSRMTQQRNFFPR
jgi:hypothetical protein